MNSPSNRRRERFQTTRWSVVMRAETASIDANAALGELAQRYAYPVFAYLRGSGCEPALAERVTRRFLQWLPGDASAGAQGAYRVYLLARLQAYLATNPADAGEATLIVPDNLQARHAADGLERLTPEQGYLRAFALQVVDRTLHRLRSEAEETGHADLYALLEPFLSRDSTQDDYERIAEQMHSRALTVIVALKRLRQRFRELAAEELVDTVTCADDLAAEQDALLAVLSDAAP